MAIQGALAIMRAEAVVPGAPARLAITGSPLNISVRGSVVLLARTTDRFGNAAPAVVRWTVSPGGAVRVSSRHAAVLVVHGLKAGTVSVTATLGRLTARARVVVR
jgi:hypothetical protein